MVFKKKKKSKEELKKEIEEIEKLEKLKEEQAKPTEKITTNAEVSETDAATIQGMIEYYNKKYAMLQLPLESIPNLLLGILNELKEMKEEE